jgi:DNA-binding MarR family transcriptional regulator
MASGNGKAARDDHEDSGIVLGILQAIDSGAPLTQRGVASDLGIALGLVNAYVKRCMKKGLVKMQSAPARRYAYYLTPKGFVEKSKLTASYLTHSFSFFRIARMDCEAVLDEALARRMNSVALVSASDLAEIVRLCATDHAVRLVGIVDPNAKMKIHAGLPVVSDCRELEACDGLIITDIKEPLLAYQMAVAAVGKDRVLVPALLKGRRMRPKAEKSAPAGRVQ